VQTGFPNVSFPPNPPPCVVASRSSMPCLRSFCPWAHGMIIWDFRVARSFVASRPQLKRICLYFAPSRRSYGVSRVPHSSLGLSAKTLKPLILTRHRTWSIDALGGASQTHSPVRDDTLPPYCTTTSPSLWESRVFTCSLLSAPLGHAPERAGDGCVGAGQTPFISCLLSPLQFPSTSTSEAYWSRPSVLRLSSFLVSQRPLSTT